MTVGNPSGGRSCEVVFFEGYKSRETPRAVRIEGREIPVERILSRRRVTDASSGEVAEEFTCRLEDSVVKILVTEQGCFLKG